MGDQQGHTSAMAACRARPRTAPTTSLLPQALLFVIHRNRYTLPAATGSVPFPRTGVAKLDILDRVAEGVRHVGAGLEVVLQGQEEGGSRKRGGQQQ